MKFIKRFYTQNLFDVCMVEDDSTLKFCPEWEDSIKIKQWLADGNVMEVVEWVAPTLAETKTNLLEQARSLVESELAKTDYKVIRHYGQVMANIETDLTPEQFVEFEKGRQTIRNKFNTYEIAVTNAGTYNDAINVELGI